MFSFTRLMHFLSHIRIFSNSSFHIFFPSNNSVLSPFSSFQGLVLGANNDRHMHTYIKHSNTISLLPQSALSPLSCIACDVSKYCTIIYMAGVLASPAATHSISLHWSPTSTCLFPSCLLYLPSIPCPPPSSCRVIYRPQVVFIIPFSPFFHQFPLYK